MCLKSVAVTGTPLLFKTIPCQCYLSLPSLSLGNCTVTAPRTIQKRPLSLVVGLRGGSIQVIQMTSLFTFWLLGNLFWLLSCSISNLLLTNLSKYLDIFCGNEQILIYHSNLFQLLGHLTSSRQGASACRWTTPASSESSDPSTPPLSR